ncbi:MAG: flavin reductase [Oscillospiraceae bacterium]|nr:flavin reductase [Oscillospiraceae bacterium]
MLSKIDVKSLHENVFTLIGERWMLIAAGDQEKCNMMTASWGGLGVLWGANVATVYIRPTRYTYELIEKQNYFTLSFFGDQYKEQLALCGKKSGRDTDKVKACGFTVEAGTCGAPYFAEAELVLVCKKRYAQDFDPSLFLVEDMEQWYPKKDYHRMYIGEIVEAYQA